MWKNVAKGAIFGAGVGATLGVVGHIMGNKDTIGDLDLGVEGIHHIHDHKTLELLGRFKVFSAVSEEGRRLYVYMVKCVDSVYSNPEPKGAEMFHMNRAFLGATTSAKALLKQSLKSNELRTAPLMDDVEELRSLLESRLHNSMIS